MRNKFLASLIVVIMLVGIFAGCTKDDSVKQEEATKAPSASEEVKEAEETAEVTVEEPVNMRYVIPGGLPGQDDRVAAVFELVNEKMLADGVNINLELYTIPWDAWEQKTNLMLATGEPFDLLHVMEDLRGFSSYVGQEALYPIDDLLDQYGENLKKVIPEFMWNSAKANGQTYAVPAFWTETTKATSGLTIRTDWIEAYGLDTPETSEDLMNVMEVFKQNWEGDGSPSVVLLYQEPARFLERTFDSYPFTVIEQMLLIRQDGSVESFVSSEEFKMEAGFFNECYDKGYITPDLLSLPSDWRENEMELGRYLFRDGNGLRSKKDMVDDNVVEDLILLAPEKATFRDMGFRNDNVVPITSENPESGIKFLNWMYANQENYDLFIYGEEGVDWTEMDDMTYETTIIDDAQNYGFATWMIGNLNYARASVNDHPTRVEVQYSFDEEAENSVIVGFTFDPTNVSVEYANCLSAVKTAIYPIKAGIVDYEAGIEKAIDEFKAAGIDAVVAEYQKQLSEYLNSK